MTFQRALGQLRQKLQAGEITRVEYEAQFNELADFYDRVLKAELERRKKFYEKESE